MNWTDVNRHIKENFPEHKGQLMFNMSELSRLLGHDRQTVGYFLKSKDVAGYTLGRRIVYCLPEVIEALNTTRCR